MLKYEETLKVLETINKIENENKGISLKEAMHLIYKELTESASSVSSASLTKTEMGLSEKFNSISLEDKVSMLKARIELAEIKIKKLYEDGQILQSVLAFTETRRIKKMLPLMQATLMLKNSKYKKERCFTDMYIQTQIEGALLSETIDFIIRDEAEKTGRMSDFIIEGTSKEKNELIKSLGAKLLSSESEADRKKRCSEMKHAGILSDDNDFIDVIVSSYGSEMLSNYIHDNNALYIKDNDEMIDELLHVNSQINYKEDEILFHIMKDRTHERKIVKSIVEDRKSRDLMILTEEYLKNSNRIKKLKLGYMFNSAINEYAEKYVDSASRVKIETIKKLEKNLIEMMSLGNKK